MIIWLYILSLFKRSNLPAYCFLIGSFGLFIALSFFSHMYLVWKFAKIIAEILNGLSRLFPYYSINLPYNLIMIKTSSDHYVQLFINYECSGALEIFAYESILIFFPIYNNIEKFILSLIGIIWILSANIIRLLLVIIVVYNYGISYLFIVHSIIGRLVFYTVVIILYYNVFTKKQIIRGWLNHRFNKKGG